MYAGRILLSKRNFHKGSSTIRLFSSPSPPLKKWNEIMMKMKSPKLLLLPLPLCRLPNFAYHLHVSIQKREKYSTAQHNSVLGQTPDFTECLLKTKNPHFQWVWSSLIKGLFQTDFSSKIFFRALYVLLGLMKSFCLKVTNLLSPCET